MFADLHLHSIYSDGTDTPNELISLAVNYGISVISITDHDSIAAYENIATEHNSKVKVIPAVEISTILDHSYVHMLGYFININSDELLEYLKETSADKTENTRVNFENAIKQGCFKYEWERVLELNKEQPRISGIHVVKALQADSFTINNMQLWDMFHKYFWAESSDFISTEKATVFDAINIIQKAAGISIIAHPKGIGDDSLVNNLLKYGAQGLEVYHPTHTKDDALRYLQIAESKKMLISGGTDWHGKNNGANITHFGMCGLENNRYPILAISL